MKNYHKLLILIGAVLIVAASTVSNSQVAKAQNAMDALQRLSGTAPVIIPPVSDPVCVYCGANRSNTSRREPHKPGCRYYEAPAGQQNTQNYSAYGNDAENYNSESGNYRHVTYAQQHIVYIPPTPIRDTPEGQAILGAIDQLGYAVGEIASEALSDFIAWSIKKIFSSKGKEYHSDNPNKQWGATGVVEQNGKEGVWDNATHKWKVKPGQYYEIMLPGPYEAVAKSLKTNKWGLFDVSEKGAELVPFVFDEVQFTTRGGTGAPIAFGAKDENGNMHWIVGHVVLQSDNQFKFITYPGDWSSLELTSMPDPKDGEDCFAIVVKDFKTGKSQILNYLGKPHFGHHQEDKYDDIIMTGMIQTNNASNSPAQNTYYDFYKVKNDGKMGYVWVEHTADMKRQLGSYPMLPCEYDDITPVASLIGGAEAKKYNHLFYSGKDLVITKKNNRFGLGHCYSSQAKEPKYKDIAHLWIRDKAGREHPVFVVQQENGTYLAKQPDGSDLYFQRYSDKVTAQDFIDMVNILKKHVSDFPDQWK